MRVVELRGNPQLYCCNIYFVLGDSNARDDVNTLVDVGTDGAVLQGVLSCATGIGKARVGQVVITHDHFDHAAGLADVVAAYSPVVRAFSALGGTARPVADGEWLRLGDRDCKVLHTPGHSSDSICVYCPPERALFSGDLPVRIQTPGGSYPRELAGSLERLVALRIDVVYTGHGGAMRGNVREMLEQTLRNVQASGVDP
jgi:glyoxylase-like metal-dependent hydrolase (beta-lactamase superfamily II)